MARHDDLTQKYMETGCGWTYRNIQELRKHYLKEHKLLITKDHRDTIYILGASRLTRSQKKCPICNLSFRGPFDHKHVLQHDKMKCKCSEPECGWMFRNFQKLEQHYQHHHLHKIYLAKNTKVCGNLIDSRKPDEKNYECFYCGCRLPVEYI